MLHPKQKKTLQASRSVVDGAPSKQKHWEIAVGLHWLRLCALGVALVPWNLQQPVKGGSMDPEMLTYLQYNS